MPLITVWNNDPYNHTCASLRDRLQEACLEVKALGLTTKADITVCFVQNRYNSSDGGPVIVIVELLFDKPERTLEVRRHLALVLGECIKAYYKEFSYCSDREVEVAVKRFSPEHDAFWRG